jgi:hypothetical protein
MRSATPPRPRSSYDVGAGLVQDGDIARYLPTGRGVRVIEVTMDGEVLIEFQDDGRCDWVKWRFVVPLPPHQQERGRGRG